ncbi:MAG: PSD1 and planctomycete cytochrome C domain-containing protein [Bacteroidota bacterium]
MKLNGIAWFILATTLFLSVALFNQLSEKSTAALPPKIDFNFHVRPILVKNCYLCHGPDSSSREADLRLDTFEDATALRKGNLFAIKPGHPQTSEVIHRINSDDPNEVMPPPASNLKLSEREKAILERWIDQGAKWKPHWAFIQPTEPRIPSVKAQEEVANEIDAFVVAKLEEQELPVATIASKNTQIRRLAYVLTGLPPHPSDIKKFMNDTSLNAYEKLVDQYLNSSQFGERWARHWMDLARYAETKGHEFDYPVAGAWQYRDYLIRAFNQDISYPQLVKEHLAGDLLASPRWDEESGRNESQLGTLFLTMTEGKHSPVDLVIDESERIDNMIDVTTKTFQALTVACSRCHDHKFDPIPTTDYYALYGMMKSSRFSVTDANLTLEKVENLAELNDIKREIRKLTAQSWLEMVPLPVQAASLQETDNPTDKDYTLLGDFRNSELSGWQSDGLAFGQRATLGEPHFDAKNQRLTYLSEGRASSRQISTGIIGALRSPNFTITEDFINVHARGKQSSVRVIIDNFQLIQNPIYGELAMEVDQPEWQNYTVDVSPWKGHIAYLEVIPGYFQGQHYHLPPEAYAEVAYAQAYNGELPPPTLLADPSDHNLHATIGRWVEGSSSAADVQYLNQHLRQHPIDVPPSEISELLQRQTKLSQSLADSAYFTGITEGFQINSPVFIRGNPKTLSEEKVPHRFLTSLSDDGIVFTSGGSSRKDLAEAIISPNNPLTFRVMVNRLWHHLFGRGIVETVDNFGLQGKLPTHPALLDYLAVKFQQEGGSIKDMIKFIVMSNTFRRAVVTDSLVSVQDPENLLLSGYPLRRLEAEAIRDGMLVVSGELDSTMFGPSVPVHLTEFMQGRGRPQKSGPLDGDGRRSIYLEVRRNFLSPMMLTFDRPIPFSTFGKRNATNVPAQSLMLMNDPMVLAQAERMAERVIAQTELNTHERIQQIYLWAFARPAREEEVNQAMAFLEQQAKAHQSENISTSVSAWKDYCHTIFNMKEFIYLI